MVLPPIFRDCQCHGLFSEMHKLPWDLVEVVVAEFYEVVRFALPEVGQEVNLLGAGYYVWWDVWYVDHLICIDKFYSRHGC